MCKCANVVKGKRWIRLRMRKTEGRMQTSESRRNTVKRKKGTIFV